MAASRRTGESSGAQHFLHCGQALLLRLNSSHINSRNMGKVKTTALGRKKQPQNPKGKNKCQKACLKDRHQTQWEKEGGLNSQ
jgi:hypothetical protein